MESIEFTVSGNVMVTKNPCSHPGDIRLLKAVGEDDPRWDQLEHLINVIVFPSKGKRPEQHKMSGGDLDGDVYMAMWDKSLIDKLTPDMIEEPANYKKYLDDSKFESDKIEDHIKRYFQKDNLGSLSNLHLALCDQAYHEGLVAKEEGRELLSWHKEGSKYNDDILKLSWLISIAVDFAKHGKCIDRDQYEKIQKR